MSERNPQAEQMADESMVRGLRAQAQAIWPQEQPMLDAYDLQPDMDCLDVGCGTGEFAFRLAEQMPQATVLGVDLIEPHLELARSRCEEFGNRVQFQIGDAFELDLPGDRFDLVVCRHMFQAVPKPEQVLAEMIRVVRPGGRLHVLTEDYGMIHFHPTDPDADRFWRDGPMQFAERTGSDLRYGRKTFTAFHRAGLRDVDLRYVTVDTLRVPRATFREIWVAWRDGYREPIARVSDLTEQEVDAYWAAMIDCLDDPAGYAVWHVPIVSGTK